MKNDTYPATLSSKPANPPRVLITGANGFIGRHLLAACLRQGLAVVACVQRGTDLNARYSELDIVYADFNRDLDAEVWLPRLRDIDAVINCVGIFRQSRRNRFENVHERAAKALFHACEQLAIRKLVQISALGADHSAFSAFHLSKKAADDYLAGLDLDWTILRPSIVYGEGANSMNLFKAMAALPITPLLQGGEQIIQPLHIDDLCQVAVMALRDKRFSRRRLDMVGAEALSFKSMMKVLKNWLGQSKQAFISMPLWLASSLSPLLGRVFNAPISSAAMNMLNAGNRLEPAQFIALSGMQPRPFSAQFKPGTASDCQRSASQHYFLLPLLRLSLGLLWMLSGYVSAFVYPLQQSLIMLDKVGLSGDIALLALYSAAGADFLLGMALIFKYQVNRVLKLQIILMLVYSLIISIALPELWSHPFAPVAKNFPLILASLLLLSHERLAWTSRQSN